MVNIFNMLGLSPSKSNKQVFKRTYDLVDFGLSADVILATAKWTEFGTVTVPAQQEITFGSNDPNGAPNVAGSPVYMKLMDTSAAVIKGKIRFALTNANETNTIVVLEETLARLSADISDRNKAVLLPEYPTRVGEDSKLLLTAYVASTKTIDFDGTDTIASIPVTVYQ